MTSAILQIIVAVCASAIIALGTWAIKVHSELVELKTWRQLFDTQWRHELVQIHDLLSEMREDIKKIREDLYKGR